jgi:predicted chitinase
MSNLTKEHLKQILPNAPKPPNGTGVDEEFDYILETLSKYEINTKNRVAAFIANVAGESGELIYVEEIATGWDYEYRADLGNTQYGDGPRYKGHGYIQITGRNNHRKAGQALGVDAESNPQILTQLPYTWLSAGWYWRSGSSWGDLNKYADAEDFASTVLGVRGGPDSSRWKYWYTALEVLPEDLTIDEVEEEWPQIKLSTTTNNWIIDPQSKKFARLLGVDSNYTVKVNEENWLYVVEEEPIVEPEPEPVFSWPYAWDAPIASSWDYVKRHPTRYNFRTDVEEWARYLVQNYDVWCNTYYDHPEGYWRTPDSLDVWGPDGRGWPIDPDLGDRIFNLLFYYEDEPTIDWIIWRATIYSAANNWYGVPFGTDDFSWHYDHIHCTYL